MSKNILLIQGHPDAGQRHLCHALEEAYAKGSTKAGHEVRRINLGVLDFPLLRSQEQWENGTLPASLEGSQNAIKWAKHVVLFFPLWMGDMPALVKGFFEQVARPGFAFYREIANPMGFKKALTGRSARVVVTMGMPALIYRFYFRAHSIRSLERNILGFTGFSPVDETLIGGVGNMDPGTAAKWLSKLEKLGGKGL